MDVILSKNIGYCFGVKRAFDLIDKNFKNFKQPVYMLGFLVHNQDAVSKLRKMGIRKASDYKKVKSGTIIISAHGITPAIKSEISKNKNIELVDMTCPMVKSVHQIALRMKEAGKFILVFGDKHHQEVKGILGVAGKKSKRFSLKSELSKIKPQSQMGLVSQTTQSLQDFFEIEKAAKARFADIEIINTICQASQDRQKEAQAMAEQAEAVMVIGSKMSANSKRLFAISKKKNRRTYFIGSYKDIKKSWLKSINRIGVLSGASTPESNIGAVVNFLEKYDSTR